MLDLIEASKHVSDNSIFPWNVVEAKIFRWFNLTFQLKLSEANMKEILPNLEKGYVQLNTFDISLKRAQDKEKIPA